MLYAGTDKITSLFAGDMGIKRVYAGSELVYERPGGFLYLELVTGSGGVSRFAPAGSSALLDSSGRTFLCKSE